MVEIKFCSQSRKLEQIEKNGEEDEPKLNQSKKQGKIEEYTSQGRGDELLSIQLNDGKKVTSERLTVEGMKDGIKIITKSQTWNCF